MNTENSIEYKLKRFEELVNNYSDVLISMIDLGARNNLLPLKYMFGIPLMKEYIQKNKIDLLEYGVKYVLVNKEEIINFDLNKLDELDDDSDDNVSRKSCVSSISDIKSTLNTNKISGSFIGIEDNEILNLIIDIKNNSKKLDKKTTKLIKGYIELLMLILEQIKMLFN